MTSPKDELISATERARASGRRVTLHAPLTVEQLGYLETQHGPVPQDLRALMEYSGGLSVDELAVSFGGEWPFEFESVSPRGLPIATDGAGNFWVVDVGSDGAWGSVLFVSHDPPVVILQERNVTAFVAQVVRGDVAQFTERYVAEVWKHNPHVMPRREALASSDVTLNSFARQLDDQFVIADLRNKAAGSGFVWGLAGPDTSLRRYQEGDLLFAIEQKQRGFFSRILAR